MFATNATLRAMAGTDALAGATAPRDQHLRAKLRFRAARGRLDAWTTRAKRHDSSLDDALLVLRITQANDAVVSYTTLEDITPTRRARPNGSRSKAAARQRLATRELGQDRP